MKSFNGYEIYDETARQKISELETRVTNLTVQIANINDRLNKICNGETETFSEGLSFESNGDGTCYVAGIGTCTSSDLLIPPTSPTGDKVIEIGENVFAFCMNLENVVIPDSVTSIGSEAFCECHVLTSVVIPDSVTSIGHSAFQGCYNLMSVVVGSGLHNILGYTFSALGQDVPNAIIDFTRSTQVPTLKATTAFPTEWTNYEIRVPASLYDEWIVATNWSIFADRIVAV